LYRLKEIILVPMAFILMKRQIALYIIRGRHD
jgi:hypothetical protein